MNQLKFGLALIFAGVSLLGRGQENGKDINKTDRSFYDIQKAFNDYYQRHAEPWKKDDAYKAFRRWEYFMEPRVYPTGKFQNANATWQALQERNNIAAKNLQAMPTASWTALGPQYVLNGLPGSGRVDCIAFDPANSSTMWVGTASGGLWKSTNGGNSWTDMNVNLPNLSIADIAINPTGSNTMYIATGDGYGYVSYNAFGGAFWGGSYSNGVMKSTDGGLTWASTPLSYNVTQNKIINRLIINPQNPGILIAVGNGGINRSSNAAGSWTQVQNGNFYDVEFNTANPNIVYAVGSNQIYKSTNAGSTWAVLPGSPMFTGRIAIETAPTNSNVIYVMDQTSSFYKSSDGGTTWNNILIPTLTLYGYYDDVLSVSPVDENVVFAAGFDMALTTDGGNTWSNPPGFIHSDNHAMEFLPGTSTVFCGNDGGIYSSADYGNNWTDLTSGLQITQFYRLGSSATNTNIVLAGAQDNGTYEYDSGTWSFVGGGDGTECLVDPTNANVMYVSSQFGDFYKTADAAATFTPLTTGSGGWVSPFVIHPTNNNILYFGGTDVRKSIDGGDNWSDISTNLTGGINLVSLAVAKSDPNYIYATTHTSVYRTADGGANWNDITSNLPINSNAMTYIAISANDPDKAWVTFSGYVSGQKIYKTVNGGLSWTNASTSLPNIPVNCIVYDNVSSNDVLYAGTDLGVYYTDNTLPGWQPFNFGLPNVIVDELEINYTSQRLIAATYGRGLWQTPITQIITGEKNSSISKSTISLYPNPNKGNFNLDVNCNGNETYVKLEIFNALGQKVYSVSDNSVTSKQYKLNLNNSSPGVYIVNIQTAFENKSIRILVE